jgi:hypothetical protein
MQTPACALRPTNGGGTARGSQEGCQNAPAHRLQEGFANPEPPRRTTDHTVDSIDGVPSGLRGTIGARRVRLRCVLRGAADDAPHFAGRGSEGKKRLHKEVQTH